MDDRAMNIPDVDYDGPISDEEDELKSIYRDKSKKDDLAELLKSWQGHPDHTMSGDESQDADEEEEMTEVWRDELVRRDEAPEASRYFHDYRLPSPAERATGAEVDSLSDDSELSCGSSEAAPERSLGHFDPEKYDCHDQNDEEEEDESPQRCLKSKSVVGSDTDNDDDMDSQEFKARGLQDPASVSKSSRYLISELARAQYQLAKSESAVMAEVLKRSMRTEGYDSMTDEDEPVLDVLSPHDLTNEDCQTEPPFLLRSGRHREDDRHQYDFGSVDPNAWSQRANEYNLNGGTDRGSLNFHTKSYFQKSYYQGDTSDDGWGSREQWIRFRNATQDQCNFETQGMSDCHTGRLMGWSGIDPADADLVPDGIDPTLIDPPLQQVSYINQLPDEDVLMLYSKEHRMSPLKRDEKDIGLWKPQEMDLKDDENLMIDILKDIRTQRGLYHEALP